MQTGNSNLPQPSVGQQQPPAYTSGQWRPGRLLFALAVMVGIIVVAWFVTR
jgi:hypothetical protein